MVEQTVVLREECHKVKQFAYRCEVCGGTFFKEEEAIECEEQPLELIEEPVMGKIYATGSAGWSEDTSAMEDFDDFWRVLGYTQHEHYLSPIVENSSGKISVLENNWSSYSGWDSDEHPEVVPEKLAYLMFWLGEASE